MLAGDAVLRVRCPYMGSYGVWSNSAILKESERWIWYPQSAERIEDDQRFLVHMPEHWGFSIVQRTTAGSEQLASDLIERTIEDTKAAGRQKLAWQVSGETEPSNLGELLATRGFEVSEELDVLAYELGSEPEPQLPQMNVSSEVTAELVRSAEGLREVHRIGYEVFSSHMPSEVDIAEYSKQLEKLERRERGELPGGPDNFLTMSFLAFIGKGRDQGGGQQAAHGAAEGRTIASAGVTLAGEVARMWGGGTLEGYRGYGAYGALVLERCRRAHALGATLALVKARVGTSGPILTRAGFEQAGTERRYELALD